MNVLSGIGEFLVLFGTVFYFLSTLGLIRMPDVYNRMQTATKSVTLGSLSTIIGVGLWALGEGLSLAWLTKTIVIAVFLLLTNPISAHTLIRGAYKSGIPLWEGSVVDKYKEHLKEKEGAE
ncbi:monovalent cation/H(+) antiporter subunit G [Pyrococcus horikoshii]|uniref:UPF0091 protein PH1455 n=2 Tax=Pyrococcus horikoshii TaxID=53953 RepID=Y1455_PYRHO|nr:monovalent cation/H(+) antiporter subunit G [Pyrococcus horikoshii]O59124.1 RecName: Full=UPF0091 protein PH1455 [Pyrococcus horikoshii OT3]BAA30562.1 120aa long hypothetical protein [Pyrococcus horikoshii OT3]HII60448.1 Na+/H+ antiporter subunit G [Pyrococcus horikoshii]